MIANRPADKILIFSMKPDMKTAVSLNMKMNMNANVIATQYLVQTEEISHQTVTAKMREATSIPLRLTTPINILMIRLLPQLRKLLVIY